MITARDITPAQKKVIFSMASAQNRDIRQLINKMVPIAVKQMSKAATKFRGETEKDTAESIWNFLKYNINYKADGNNQIVKAPSALMRDKVGDCKSYAVFTSAVLSNLGIPHSLVYTSYTNDPIPSHVYVITANGYIIDAVYTSFNKEKPPKYKYIKAMNLKGITGTGPTVGDQRQIGAIWDKKSDTARNLNKVALYAPRQAFYKMVRNNVWGLAKIIYNSYTYQKTSTVTQWQTAWYNLGGSWSKLANAIRDGYNKPAIGFKYAPAKIKELYASHGQAVNGVGDLGVVLDIITWATKIIEKLFGLIGTAYKGAADAGVLPPPKDPPPGTKPIPDGEGTSQASMWLIGAAALGALLYGMDGKKLK